MLLNTVKPGMIEDWKLWALEKGVGVRRVNAVLQAMRTAVHYAVSRGDLPIDPFRAVRKVPVLLHNTSGTKDELNFCNNSMINRTRMNYATP